jgi:hypothetical protein
VVVAGDVWEACDHAAAAEVYAELEMEEDDLDTPARELYGNEIGDLLEAEDAWRVCVFQVETEDSRFVEFEAGARGALGNTAYTYSENAEFVRVSGKGYAGHVNAAVGCE